MQIGEFGYAGHTAANKRCTFGERIVDQGIAALHRTHNDHRSERGQFFPWATNG